VCRDQVIRSTDGVQLATTLYEPRGKRTATGWPAIVMFHGIGGTRASMNTIAEQTFANEGFVVLTFDHRRHGESGGFFDADGQSEIAAAITLQKWLSARPEIDGTHIGAWDISLGGGVVWRTVQFSDAAVVNETWVDLYGALAPNDLAKSGALFGLLSQTKKAWKTSFPLIHDTALVSRGSKLRLTLSCTSTAQSPANLLYLTGVPGRSSLTIKSASVKLPVLRRPISG
jgi:X-Pro dipeptidyl-peptidase (S15 family)